jgi:hypothetical protein
MLRNFSSARSTLVQGPSEVNLTGPLRTRAWEATFKFQNHNSTPHTQPHFPLTAEAGPASDGGTILQVWCAQWMRALGHCAAFMHTPN